MMTIPRVRKAIALAVTLGVGATAMLVAAKPDEQVIKVVAKRFDYTPNVIKLKKGVPVVLELTTQDVIMGFSAPDFATRVDIIPGKVVEVRIVPDKRGRSPSCAISSAAAGTSRWTGRSSSRTSGLNRRVSSGTGCLGLPAARIICSPGEARYRSPRKLRPRKSNRVVSSAGRAADS